jgi:hypothetical protein
MGVAEYACPLCVSIPTPCQCHRRLGTTRREVEVVGTKLAEVTLARSAGVTADGLGVRVGYGLRSIEVPRGIDESDPRGLVAA